MSSFAGFCVYVQTCWKNILKHLEFVMMVRPFQDLQDDKEEAKMVTFLVDTYLAVNVSVFGTDVINISEEFALV